MDSGDVSSLKHWGVVEKAPIQILSQVSLGGFRQATFARLSYLQYGSNTGLVHRMLIRVTCTESFEH